MTITPDKKHFIFTLYDGYFWDESRGQNAKNATCPFFYAKFDKQYMRIDLSSFEMQKIDESFFRSNNKSLTLKQLGVRLDTMQMELSQIYKNISLKYYDQTVYYRCFVVDNPQFDPMKSIAQEIDFQHLSPQQKGQCLELAKQKTNHFLGHLVPARDVYKMNQLTYYLYEIEWHRKLVLSLACFLFFFIGAPLGTIIRKGGIGIPLVVTVAFFAFYFVVSIIGEKMAKSGDIPVWFGMWLSTMIVFPLGIYLTYKAAMDSAIMSADAYSHFFKKITRLFKKK